MIYIFDSETSDLQGEVIEVALLKIEINQSAIKVCDEFSKRFKPSKPIAVGAMSVHHIIDDDLKDCEPSSSFKLPDDAQYIIGHNVDFDWARINKPDVKRICTLALARMIWSNTTHKLSDLIYYLLDDKNEARNIAMNLHSAMADAWACKLLLEKIIASSHIDSVEALYDASEKSRRPTVMTFGKHKGVKISEVPRDWMRWYLRQDNPDHHLVNEFNKYL